MPQPRFGWDIVVEAAAKIAVDGERFLLSTGKDDYGMQATFTLRRDDTAIRVISARDMSRKERAVYEQAPKDHP